MGLKELLLLALGVAHIGDSEARISRNAKRQGSDSTRKYCPGGTDICFSEYTSTAGVIYRIAIPDVPAAPFDILLEIVAPVSATWAGIAWGGSMTNNPLTVGWPSGSSPIVSSRWATGHTVPQAYTGAKYSVLQTSTVNTTHWQLDVLCQGCSTWGTTSLNPNGTNTLAWAKSSRAVTTPASNTSIFAYHDGRGSFSHDFSAAKIPKGIFDALVYDLDSGTSPSSTAKPSSSATAPPHSTVSSSVVGAPSSTATVKTTSTPHSVITGVTTLPHVSTTTPVKSLPSPVSTSITYIPDPPVSQVTKPTAVSNPTTYVTIVVTETEDPDDGPTVTAAPLPVVTSYLPPFFGPPWFKGKGKGWGPPFRRPPIADPDRV